MRKSGWGWSHGQLQQREKNADRAFEELKAAGIEYAILRSSDPILLKVSVGLFVIDFYPEAGRWNLRGETKWHRGIDSLLRRVAALKDRKQESQPC